MVNVEVGRKTGESRQADGASESSGLGRKRKEDDPVEAAIRSQADPHT